MYRDLSSLSAIAISLSLVIVCYCCVFLFCYFLINVYRKHRGRTKRIDDLRDVILGFLTLTFVCCCCFFFFCYLLLNMYEKCKRRTQNNDVSVLFANIEPAVRPPTPPPNYDTVVFFPQEEAPEDEGNELPEVALECDSVVRFYPQYSDDLPTYEEAVGV